MSGFYNHPGSGGLVMLLAIIILSVYLLVMVLLDYLPGRKKKKDLSLQSMGGSDNAFFLSGKTMTTAVLLISTAATNFSAFTILGLSGAGYRVGYAFYPVMAFGTGFMALGMYLIGSPLGTLGRERNYISPSDFISDRYSSPVLTRIYAAVLVILTLPYLALQPMAAGILLETAFGVPYRVGVIICAIVVGLYTTRGGMRAVARTDLFQGVIIVVLAAAAYTAVIRWMGGFEAAHNVVFKTAPELLGRFGGGKGIGPAVLAGYIVLWFFADPMFPQLNQRLLAAKDQKSLERTVAIYPVITMILFFLTISVGVIGAGVLPELSSGEADRIWPTLISRATSPSLLALFMLAPLAAIMSTLDSQLLSLSSIITRDLLGKKDTGRKNIRWITAAISAAGLVIALFPPQNILEFISKSSFLGYAALSPLVFGGLYSKKLNAAGAFSSIIAGEGLTLLFGVGIISSGAVPAVFIICSASWAAMIIGSRLYRRGSDGEFSFPVYKLSDKLPLKWGLVFGLLFVLGCDFINYFIASNSPDAAAGGISLGGLPGWIYYQGGLCLVLALAFYAFFRSKKSKNNQN